MVGHCEIIWLPVLLNNPCFSCPSLGHFFSVVLVPYLGCTSIWGWRQGSTVSEWYPEYWVQWTVWCYGFLGWQLHCDYTMMWMQILYSTSPLAKNVLPPTSSYSCLCVTGFLCCPNTSWCVTHGSQGEMLVKWVKRFGRDLISFFEGSNTEVLCLAFHTWSRLKSRFWGLPRANLRSVRTPRVHLDISGCILQFFVFPEYEPCGWKKMSCCYPRHDDAKCCISIWRLWWQMLGKHDLKIFEILFEMYNVIMIIRGYCMVLYGTVWYCMVLYGTVWSNGTVWYCMVLYGTVMLYDFVSYVIHFLAANIFMSEVRQIGRLGGVYPKQGTCSRRGNRTRKSFRPVCWKYCHIAIYCFHFVVTWCYVMLQYVTLPWIDAGWWFGK